MKAYQQTLQVIGSLGFKGLGKELDNLIHDAEQNKLSYLSFLHNVLNSELNDRSKRRLHRNFTSAHFPVQKSIDAFEFNKVKGISKTDVSNLMDCAWLDRHENILLFGPPGVGKTHLSIALGMLALNKGYTVCFERITNLMRLIKTSQIQKTSEYRIKKIQKSNLFIIDEIGYTPIDKKEANLFFNLISELYEKSSIIITSNKSFDDWAEMLGDQIMTTALLNRLLHYSRIFNLSGASYRLKNINKNMEVN